MGSLHSQDHYKAVVKELRAAGLEWTVHHGGVHSYLAVQVNGRIEKVTLADSPSDWRAPRAARALIRKRIRQWKADAAGCRAETASALLPTLEVEGTMQHNLQFGGTSNAIIYAGHAIRDRGEMLSLTDMWRAAREKARADGRAAKEFDSRRPADWLRGKAAKQFIEALELIVGKSHLIEADAGRAGETMAHWQIGLAYAKYVSPEFHLWCNDVVRAHMEGIGEQSGAVMVAHEDDTAAFLSIMAEMRSDILAAQQSKASTAVEHIDGAKAAILHYIKTYLRGPADDFYADMRGAAANRVLRDTAMRDAMVALTGAVTELLRRAKPAVDERPFFWSEWFDTARIYAEHFPGRTIPKKGFLSMAIAKGLDSHCKQHRKFHHMEQRIVGGHPRNFWHKDSVWEWLEAGGRDVVEAHVRRHMPAADVIAIDAARQARP